MEARSFTKQIGGRIRFMSRKKRGIAPEPRNLQEAFDAYTVAREHETELKTQLQQWLKDHPHSDPGGLSAAYISSVQRREAAEKVLNKFNDSHRAGFGGVGC